MRLVFDLGVSTSASSQAGVREASTDVWLARGG
jgi:hypothetical protein